MRRYVRIALIDAAILCVVSAAAVLAGAAYAVEGAMRPARLPVALVCPCLSHMRCGPVSTTARDGVVLRGWYYTPDRSINKAIILFHGVGGNREGVVALGNLFLKQGYSVLEPDLRGHGESGGIVTYGALEGGDTSAWVDWLQKTPEWNGIYGFGTSLGASVLLESLAHETRFRAVVAESPFFDFRSVADERIARMLPAGTKWIAGPFVESGILWARVRDGVDLTRASAAEGLRATATPVLLIHGLEDGKTSPDNSRRLVAAHPEAQLWLVPGSHHADAWSTARGAFEARVLNWFRER